MRVVPPIRSCAIVLCCLVAGCATFDPQRVHLTGRIQPPLPPLRLAFDDEPMMAHLGSYAFVFDLREILDRELVAAVCADAPDPPAGTLRVGMTKSKQHSAVWLPILPTALTLTAINILGFPFYGQSATVVVTLTVLDGGGHVVGTFEGKGSATEWAAYFWGYRGAGAARTQAVGPDRTSNDLSRATVAAAGVRAVDAAMTALATDAARLRAVLGGL